MFSYFYNKTIYYTDKVKVKELTGKIVTKYTKIDKPIKCDIQPIEEKMIKTTWGKDITSTYQVYCNKRFNIEDIIVWEDEAFAIGKVIKWDTYNLYAIYKKDVVVI